MFMALAHTSEEVAREFARKIIKAWEDDPLREAHHRITWKFLRLGMFFDHFRFFSDGAPFCQLDARFQQMVAASRFPAGVETTIKSMHGSVLPGNDTTWVQFASTWRNRLPWMERLLARRHIDCKKCL